MILRLSSVMVFAHFEKIPINKYLDACGKVRESAALERERVSQKKLGGGSYVYASRLRRIRNGSANRRIPTSAIKPSSGIDTEDPVMPLLLVK